MLLVLTGVTAVSVALLAYVNELTKGPIAEANAKTLNEALKKVLPEFTNNPVAESDTIFSEKDGKKNVDFIVYPAKNGEELVGTAVEAKSMGFGGELKVLVGFNAEGKIYNYSLLAHTETPGLGSKADKWFGAYDPAKGEKAVSHEESTKSILGMNPGEAPLTVSKDGGAVDAITASTISSRTFLIIRHTFSTERSKNTLLSVFIRSCVSGMRLSDSTFNRSFCARVSSNSCLMVSL